jgi:hypothetical protein
MSLPPTTVGAEERGGRGTTLRRTTTRAAPERSPPPSARAHVPSPPANAATAQQKTDQVPIRNRILFVMLADAGAPAVLADAPQAVMLADAGAPAVLAATLRRLWWQMLAPPSPCIRSCGGYAGRCWCIPQSLHWFLRRLCSHFWRPLPLPPALPPLPPPPAPPHRRSAAPPCRRQPAPRGAHGTCPAASRARTCVPSAPCPQCAAGCELHGRRHASGGRAERDRSPDGGAQRVCREVNRGERRVTQADERVRRVVEIK